MKNLWPVSVIVVCLLIVPQYVQATDTTEITLDLSFTPLGDPNQTVNRLDEGATTNRDTWDPTPQGVYVGPWTPDSLYQMDLVPDDNCTVALATVVKFRPEAIMSGVSNLLVRLPVFTGDWDEAYLDIYHIRAGCNWTFTRGVHDNGGADHKLNNVQVNFTSGWHQLIYWSRTIEASDTSPTDGNDHFTRSNRTYVSVTAPIIPEEYYLFVAYIKYPNDSYIQIYWSPESLTSGEWNRTTLASYMDVAPDTYDLQVDNFAVSLGWSFDMRFGFGNGGSCWQTFFYDDDQIRYMAKLNKSNFDDSNYLSLMVPFWADINNVSIGLSCYLVDPDDNTNLLVIDSLDEWTDFLLVSSDDTLATMMSGYMDWEDWDGWVWVVLSIHNDTRLRFFMKDPEALEEASGFNYSWYAYAPSGQPLSYVWDSNFSWDPTGFFQYNSDTLYEVPGFRLQYSLQATDFQWSQTTPPAVNEKTAMPEWNVLDWLEGLFWTTATFLLGGQLALWCPEGYFGMPGIIIGLLYRYANDLIDLPPFLADPLDAVWDALTGLGKWLWKVGQAIIGAITWLAENIVYYGSIILGIIILLLAFTVFFFPIWVSIKIGMIFRSVVFGDLEAAQENVAQIMAVTRATAEKGRKAIGILRRFT